MTIPFTLSIGPEKIIPWSLSILYQATLESKLSDTMMGTCSPSQRYGNISSHKTTVTKDHPAMEISPRQDSGVFPLSIMVFL
jgi:hypothetical protein